MANMRNLDGAVGKKILQPFPKRYLVQRKSSMFLDCDQIMLDLQHSVLSLIKSII